MAKAEHGNEKKSVYKEYKVVMCRSLPSRQLKYYSHQEDDHFVYMSL